MRIVHIFAEVFLLLWFPYRVYARWQWRKRIPHNKIPPVHRLLLGVVRLPEDLSFITWKSLCILSVKCIKARSIIVEYVLCIANTRIGNKNHPQKGGRSLVFMTHLSGFTKMILVSAEDPHSIQHGEEKVRTHSFAAPLPRMRTFS